MVSNATARQAVFFRVREWLTDSAHEHALTMGFIALMIDQGFAFNGAEWNFTDSPVQGLYPGRMV